MIDQPNNQIPSDLPTVFRWREARDAGLTDRRLKRLTNSEVIQRIEHGLYSRAGSVVEDLALINITLIKREETLCLASALSH